MNQKVNKPIIKAGREDVATLLLIAAIFLTVFYVFHLCSDINHWNTNYINAAHKLYRNILTSKTLTEQSFKDFNLMHYIILTVLIMLVVLIAVRWCMDRSYKVAIIASTVTLILYATPVVISAAYYYQNYSSNVNKAYNTHYESWWQEDNMNKSGVVVDVIFPEDSST